MGITPKRAEAPQSGLTKEERIAKLELQVREVELKIRLHEAKRRLEELTGSPS